MIPDLNIKSITLTTIIIYSLTSAVDNTGIRISVEASKVLESGIICRLTDTGYLSTPITIYDATVEISIEIPKILKLGIYCDSTKSCWWTE